MSTLQFMCRGSLWCNQPFYEVDVHLIKSIHTVKLHYLDTRSITYVFNETFKNITSKTFQG